MARDCNVRIKFDGDNTIYDCQEQWGFILNKSSETIIPPTKDYDVEVYPEENAAHVNKYATYEPFDYTITFIAIGTEIDINAKIRDFYNRCVDNNYINISMPNLKKMRKVTVYNDFRGVRFSGYAKPYKGKNIVSADGNNINITFEFVVYVDNSSTLTDITQHD